MKTSATSDDMHSVSETRAMASAWDVHFQRLAVMWLVAASLLVLTNHLLWLQHRFTYPHSWSSANTATAARAFVHHGVRELRGVPIQNNPPDGLKPDMYIHWPPLPAIELSVVFRAVGESEAAAHGLMLALLFGNSLALYVLVRACYPPLVGLLAVCASLVAPLTVHYGHMLSPEPFGNTGMLLSLLGFIKARETEPPSWGWFSFSAASMAMAVLSNWAPMLMPPGLLAMALLRRNSTEIRLALMLNLVAVMTFSGLVALYLSVAPHLASDLWHSISVRAGFGSAQSPQFDVHTLYNMTEHLDDPRHSLLGILWLYTKRLSLLGIVPAVATVWVLFVGWRCRQRLGDRPAPLLFAGLFAPWLVWFVLMSEYAVIHEFAMLLALPLASVAFGVFAANFPPAVHRETKTRMQGYLLWLVRAAVAVGMLVPLVLSIQTRLQDPKFWDDRKFYHAMDIQRFTEPGSVVIEPSASMVPVYYSRRHLIRGAANDALVEMAAKRLPEVFPGSPIYVALNPDDLDRFSRSMERYRLVKKTSHLVLLAVTAPHGRNGP